MISQTCLASNRPDRKASDRQLHKQQAHRGSLERQQILPHAKMTPSQRVDLWITRVKKRVFSVEIGTFGGKFCASREHITACMP
jgi:hypothetical protein